MISLVEYGPVTRSGEQGLAIIFTYDEKYKDSYELFGQYMEKVNTLMYTLPDPEALLVEIKNLMNLTVH